MLRGAALTIEPMQQQRAVLGAIGTFQRDRARHLKGVLEALGSWLRQVRLNRGRRPRARAAEEKGVGGQIGTMRIHNQAAT